jgi:hypothetical protein
MTSSRDISRKLHWLLHGDDDSSVAAPAAGATALGGAYGGLRFLNNSLNRHGWSEANGFNRNTMNALNSYLKIDPSIDDFGLHYVDRTYKALSSPLFKDNPQKVYDILLNGSKETRAVRGLAKDVKQSLLGKIIDKLSGGRFGGALESAGAMNSITDDALTKGTVDAEMTHMPAMGRSFQDAYLRGLQETGVQARVSPARGGMGLKTLVGDRARMLAESLVGDRPRGMTSLDYLNKLIGNDRAISIPGQPGKYRAVRRAYADALDYAKQLIGDTKDVGEATEKLIAAMGGRANSSISSVVGNLVGTAPKWDLLPTGKVGIKSEIKPGRIAVNSLEDAMAAAKNNLALKLMHGDMSRTFSTASSHHIAQIRGPQILGLLRNKLLRRGIGLSSLGLGGLAAYNAIRNRKNKNTSILDRILGRG